MSDKRKGIPTADAIMADPSASYWLKDAIRTSLDRDPIDAANDAEFLAKFLGIEADILLGR